MDELKGRKLNRLSDREMCVLLVREATGREEITEDEIETTGPFLEALKNAPTLSDMEFPESFRKNLFEKLSEPGDNENG